MGYYMTGDFYRRPLGDYYRGDPGFWSTIGGLAKGAVGAIPGVGPIISGALSGLGKSTVKALPAPTAAAVATMGTGMLSKATKGVSSIVKAHPILTAAGAAGIIGAGIGAGGLAGVHALRGGGGGRRHRRMRVTNPKALRRAIRRTQGFAKLAMKTIHLVHPKRRATFGGFRKRRKKR